MFKRLALLGCVYVQLALLVGACGPNVSCSEDTNGSNAEEGLSGEEFNAAFETRQGRLFRRGSETPVVGTIVLRGRNESIVVREQYLNGMRHGVTVGETKDGAILSEAWFLKGKMHGLYVRRYANGRMRAQQMWEMGRIVGISLYFHENGVLSHMSRHDGNGHVVETTYYDRVGEIVQVVIP